LELFFKLNIPYQNVNKNPDEKDSTFKGSFYYSFYNQKNRVKLTEDNIYEVSAEDISSDWYSTSILVDPFLSFGIDAGSYVISDNKNLYFGNINKNLSGGLGSIRYDFKDEKGTLIKNSPLILNKFKNNTVFSLYKDDVKWLKGNLFVNSLVWGYDENQIDTFTYTEHNINNENNSIITYFENKYLAKIFVGSISHKIFSNNYYVSFGPDGTDMEELDIKKMRDFTGLPYGYLIGKIGVNGTPFPVGSGYYYTPTLTREIYTITNETSTSLEITKDLTSDNK
ncbi:MAG TPA: hypothetical protein PK771_14365, partial [Spirochaetota bacterium]|nr:hypothetical protein [Spirochaetota bacterium]